MVKMNILPFKSLGSVKNVFRGYIKLIKSDVYIVRNKNLF